MAVAGAYSRCSEGGLSTGSKAIKNMVLLLPDSCTCSLLIEAGREGQTLQALRVLSKHRTQGWGLPAALSG